MKKIALLVGVEEYHDKRIAPLQFARADVEALGSTLGEHCDFDIVRQLVGHEGEHCAALVNVVTALEDLAAELRPDDLFLFYFSGHGVEVDGRGYLLLHDSLLAYPEHGSLSLELLRRNLTNLEARQRVLLFDACRNDPKAGRGDANNPMGDGISKDIAAVARSSQSDGTTTALLSACGPGQRAYEWPAKGHGVFSHYLIDGIKQAAWVDQKLGFRELAAYTAREVRRWSDKAAGASLSQEPWYEEFGLPEPILLGCSIASKTDVKADQTSEERRSESPSYAHTPGVRHEEESPRTHCPNCTKSFRLKPELAGRRVRCPACNKGFQVTDDLRVEPLSAKRILPRISTDLTANGDSPSSNSSSGDSEHDSLGPPTTEPPSSAAAIRVSCPSCTEEFRAKPEFAGKRVRCPACSKGFHLKNEMSNSTLMIKPVPRHTGHSRASHDTHNTTSSRAEILSSHSTQAPASPSPMPLTTDRNSKRTIAIISGVVALAVAIAIACFVSREPTHPLGDNPLDALHAGKVEDPIHPARLNIIDSTTKKTATERPSRRTVFRLESGHADQPVAVTVDQSGQYFIATYGYSVVNAGPVVWDLANPSATPVSSERRALPPKFSRVGTNIYVLDNHILNVYSDPDELVESNVDVAINLKVLFPKLWASVTIHPSRSSNLVILTYCGDMEERYQHVALLDVAEKRVVWDRTIGSSTEYYQFGAYSDSSSMVAVIKKDNYLSLFKGSPIVGPGVSGVSMRGVRFESKGRFSRVAFDSSGRRLVLGASGKSRLVSPNTGLTISDFSVSGDLGAYFLNESTLLLIGQSGDSVTVSLVDTVSGKTMNDGRITLGENLGRIRGFSSVHVSLINDGTHIALTFPGYVCIARTRPVEQVARLYSFDSGKDWLIVTASDKYTGSDFACSLVRWRIGDEVFGPKQRETDYKSVLDVRAKLTSVFSGANR